MPQDLRSYLDALAVARPEGGPVHRMRLAFIGYGAIGRAVGQLIREGAAGSFDVTGVLVRHPENYVQEEAATSWPFTSSIVELLSADPRVVVDLAGHESLRMYGSVILRSGRTLVTIAAGALSDDALAAELAGAAAEGRSRMVLPSGAIAGLDGIESAALAGLDQVTHTVRKPPAALLSPDEAEKVMASGEARELYRGPAREATVLFPQNVNVVAMVSLAGIGMDRTEVRVVADPGVEHNTHDVMASGPSGTIEIRVRNVPSIENPKTGMIVAPSVIRALRRIDATLVLGG